MHILVKLTLILPLKQFDCYEYFKYWNNMQLNFRKIILGSGSPRRKQLLEEIGLEFEIIIPAGEENYEVDLTPELAILKIAKAKNIEIQNFLGQKIEVEKPIIITADTMVIIGDQSLGKAKDDQEAAKYLQMLSGQTHEVITGHLVFDSKNNQYFSKAISSKVTFKTLSQKEIADYVATGETQGKAGAYAGQGIGGKFISNFEGDYPSFVGISKNYIYETLSGLLGE